MNWDESFMNLYPQRANGVEEDQIPWNDPNYLFQVKYDGDRRLLYITNSGNRNTSRSKGADTGIPVEKTDNVPHISNLIIPQLNQTILDCEFVHPLGFQEGVRKIMGCLPEKAIQRQKEMGLIEIRVFDILCLKGEFLHNEKFSVRQEILKATYETYLKSIPFINLVEECHGTEEELKVKLNQIIDSGGEGMVAKHIDSKYRLSTEKCQSPLKNAWIKVKCEYNGDFVVMGYEDPTREFEGKTDLNLWLYWSTKLDGTKTAVTKNYYMNWIGGIIYGDYQDGVLTKAGVLSSSSFTEAERALISENKEFYMGKVVEINAMSRHPKDRTVRHARFVQWREDKKPEDCTYENQKG
jgi:ATP-dependent DNA ligase